MTLYGKKLIRGFTLVELLAVTAMAAIPILAVGILLVSSQKNWQKIYAKANGKIRQDALSSVVEFGSVGRKSNRANYDIYTVKNGNYDIAKPDKKTSVAKGQAVEFIFWDDGFDPANVQIDSLDATNTGTHYALFYLDNNRLMLDCGHVINGKAGVDKGKRITSNIISTRIIAENINLTSDNEIFSHTVVGETGQGCVKMEFSMADQAGRTADVKTATLLRTMWPR